MLRARCLVFMRWVPNSLVYRGSHELFESVVFSTAATVARRVVLGIHSDKTMRSRKRYCSPTDMSNIHRRAFFNTDSMLSVSQMPPAELPATTAHGEYRKTVALKFASAMPSM
jgi:hypothetical protein